jgi:hypothetical protein
MFLGKGTAPQAAENSDPYRALRIMWGQPPRLSSGPGASGRRELARSGQDAERATRLQPTQKISDPPPSLLSKPASRAQEGPLQIRYGKTPGFAAQTVGSNPAGRVPDLSWAVVSPMPLALTG